MTKQKKDDLFWLKAFIFWKLFIYIISLITPYVISSEIDFVHRNRWLNFDGMHYLKIAREGYFQFSEAFFPLYPLTIRLIGVFHIPDEFGSLLISNTAFLAGLYIFYRMMGNLDSKNAKWAVLLLLAYPSSFFFQAGYTEGLYFFLSISCIYLINLKKWFWAGIAGGLASATRLSGVFLVIFALIEYYNQYKKTVNVKSLLSISLIPMGLVCFMIYLYFRNNDPLAFFHIQPLFGANRSGSEFILLPQVYWRYLKIIFSAFLQPTPLSYLVSVWELIITTITLLIFWIFRQKISLSLYIYSLMVFFLPTLTGTLSSMPRYILSSFGVFMMLSGSENTKLKIAVFLVFGILSIFNVSLFLQGRFVG